MRAQSDWGSTLSRAASIAADQGHFRAGLHCGQFAIKADGFLLSPPIHFRFLDHLYTTRALTELLLRVALGAPSPQTVPEVT